jgi:hypothetical protein
MQLNAAPRQRRVPKANRRFQPSPIAQPTVAAAPARPVWDESAPIY